jgi:hypothetical protein
VEKASRGAVAVAGVNVVLRAGANNPGASCALVAGIVEPHQFSKNCYSLNVDEHFDPCNASVKVVDFWTRSQNLLS